MSEKYKIFDQEAAYFITFAVHEWIDVFTSQRYRDIVLSSLRYCQAEKGLVIYGWCLMSNHIHLIVGRNAENKIEEIIRDFKKYTSVHICRAIQDNVGERRRSWLLQMFSSAADESNKHLNLNFGKTNTIRSS